MTDVLFLEESLQAIYLYFKDYPLRASLFMLFATADSWTTFLLFCLWIPLSGLNFAQEDERNDIFYTAELKKNNGENLCARLSSFILG